MNLSTKQLRTMFLKMEEQEREVIVTKKAYVDLTGDLIAGTLLSQIAYWNKPSKKSQESGSSTSRLKVKKKNDKGEVIEWLAKGREDWWDEIRISKKQFDRASKILEDKGFIEKKTFKFDSNPTVHVRIIWENFLPEYMKITGLFEEEEVEEAPEKEPETLEPPSYSPKGNNDIPQKGKTIFTDGEEPSLPKGKNVIDQRGKSLTEITNIDYKQENTNKDYEHENLNLNHTNEYIWKLRVPMPLKKFFSDKVKDLVNDITFDISEIEYFYNTYKEYIDPHCTREDTHAINDIEFSKAMKKMYLEVNRPISNMEGLVKSWVQWALHYKIENNEDYKSMPY